MGKPLQVAGSGVEELAFITAHPSKFEHGFHDFEDEQDHDVEVAMARAAQALAVHAPRSLAWME